MLNPLKSTATLAAIKLVEPIPPASAGKDWKGVPHGQLLTSLRKRADDEGLTLKLHAAHLGRHGADLAAGFLVAAEAGGLPPLPGSWLYGLGVATSNANRYRLRFYVGAYHPTVLGETDGWAAVVTHVFRAEKRYTTQFDLAHEVATAVERWKVSASKLGKRLGFMDAAKLSKPDATALLVAAIAANLTPPSRAFQALKLFPEKNGTALNLLAAFGATAAKNPPDVQQDQLLGFFGSVKAKVVPPKPAKA